MRSTCLSFSCCDRFEGVDMTAKSRDFILEVEQEEEEQEVGWDV